MKKQEGIRDVFKNIKHKKPAQIFCPKCCSPKIKLMHSLNYWLTPKVYICEECGYNGPVVMELEKEEEK